MGTRTEYWDSPTVGCQRIYKLARETEKTKQEATSEEVVAQKLPEDKKTAFQKGESNPP